MKKGIIIISIFIALIGLGCFLITHFIGAGVVGRIQYFDFNYPLQNLENEMNKIIELNEKIEKVSSDDYFNLTHSQKNPLYQDFKASDAKYSYLSIIDKDDKYIFRYKTHGKDSTSQITLISAAEYGKGLDLAKNIGYFKKKKYRNIFEEQFILKLKQKLAKK